MAVIEHGELQKVIRIGNLSRECVAENQFASIMNHELMDLFGSGSAVFMEFDRRKSGLRLNSSTSFGIDNIHGTRYVDHYHRYDPCYKKLVELSSNSPQHSVSTEQVITNERRYINSEYYQDFMSKTGVHRSLIFTLADHTQATGIIGLHRDKNRPAYTKQDHLKVQLISPYLNTAVLFRQKERELRRQNLLKKSIISSSNVHAYLLFDQNLICLDSGGQTLTMGALINDLSMAPGRHCDELFSKETSALVKKGFRKKAMSEDDLVETFDNLVRAQHIRLESFKADDGENLLLMLILNENIELICAERMKYFDLTAREQEVVRLVQLGFTNPQISSSLNISHKTVENHLTRIYAKTYTHNKTSLLRQLHI